MNFEQLANAFRDEAKHILSKGDKTAKFRANSYERVANKLAKFDAETKVTTDAINKLDITDYMKNKATSFMKAPSSSRSRSRTKKSRNKSRSRSTSPKTTPPKTNVKLLIELTDFMGIGPERANKLIDAGIKNVNQLHMKKYKALLTDETKKFLDLKPLTKIPHDHISILEPHLMKVQDDDLSLTITGSYRRGTEFSSDIDLMVVSDKENAIELLTNKLNTILPNKVFPYSKGRDKMSFLVDMTEMSGSPDSKIPLVYKIDAFRTTPEDKIAMLLYSTGSKEFNVMMRGKAKKMGYLLNQKGLFKNGEKIKDLNTEKDYFDILEMEYLEPEERD